MGDLWDAGGGRLTGLFQIVYVIPEVYYLHEVCHSCTYPSPRHSTPRTVVLGASFTCLVPNLMMPHGRPAKLITKLMSCFLLTWWLLIGQSRFPLAQSVLSSSMTQKSMFFFYPRSLWWVTHLSFSSKSSCNHRWQDSSSSGTVSMGMRRRWMWIRGHFACRKSMYK